jgi:hypothetical protein
MKGTRACGERVRGIAREYAGHAEACRGNSKTSRERHRERKGAARRLFPALPRWANFCRAYGADGSSRFDLRFRLERESTSSLGRQFVAASGNLQVRATRARGTRRGVARKLENIAGKTPRKVPSSLPPAGSQDKLALRAVFSRRFRAGSFMARLPSTPPLAGSQDKPFATALRASPSPPHSGKPALVACFRDSLAEARAR